MLEAYDQQDAQQQQNQPSSTADTTRVGIYAQQDFYMFKRLREATHVRFRLSTNVTGDGMWQALAEFVEADERFATFCIKYGLEYTAYPANDRLTAEDIERITSARSLYPQNSIELKKALESTIKTGV